MDRLDCDRMFIAVMETGSFTAAAARLGTHSGQASKLVSRLENELGVRLLNRTTRAVTPTEAGHAYFNRLRPLLDDYRNLDASIRDATSSPRGRLRLTAPLTFGTSQLVPALNAFALHYPQIELDVSLSDRMADLVEDGFDMAVRIGRPRDATLIARRLCEVRFVVVGADAYLAERPAPESPDDLARHACILDANFPDPNRWPFAEGGAERDVAVTGRIRYSDAEACLQAAEAGLGLAYLPSFVAGPAIRAGRVRQVLRDQERAPAGVHALYPHSRHLAAKVRALIDFLAERYRGTPHWEEGW